MSNRIEDWSTAESLAIEYLKTEMQVQRPISLRHFDQAPFLLAAWWEGGGAYVLVYGGKVHTTRGVAALPGFFAFLGAARLRAFSIDELDGVLHALGASRPTPPDVGAPWRDQDLYQDLFPRIVEQDGVLKYIVHYVQVALPLPPELGGPRTGSRAPGWPMTLQKWSLQLFPPVKDLDWRLEGRVQRPAPPERIP